MAKNQNACCPECGASISFKKFVLLNNFSATNCDNCNTRMEISNRNANALIAGISVCVSAVCIVLCAWYGQAVYQSFIGGLLTGLGIAILLIVFICWYAYTHSKLNKMNYDTKPDRRINYDVYNIKATS